MDGVAPSHGHDYTFVAISATIGLAISVIGREILISLIKEFKLWNRARKIQKRRKRRKILENAKRVQDAKRLKREKQDQTVT